MNKPRKRKTQRAKPSTTTRKFVANEDGNVTTVDAQPASDSDRALDEKGPTESAEQDTSSLVKRVTGIALSDYLKRELVAMGRPDGMAETQQTLMVAIRQTFRLGSSSFAASAYSDWLEILLFEILPALLVGGVSFGITYVSTRYLGQWIGAVVAALPLGLCWWFARESLKTTIGLKIENGNIAGLNLGALGKALNWYEEIRFISWAVMATFCTQVAFLHALSSPRITVIQAALASLNAPLSIITFGINEKLGLHLGHVPELQSLAGKAVMSIGNANYGALIIAVGIYLRRWWKLRPVLDVIPADADYDQTLAVIDAVCGHPSNPGKELHDEMLFLTLVEYYIRGEFDMVRELSTQFPYSDIDDDCRKMFVEPATLQPLFAPRLDKEVKFTLAGNEDPEAEQRRTEYALGVFNRTLELTRVVDADTRYHAVSDMTRLKFRDEVLFLQRLLELVDDESKLTRIEVARALRDFTSRPGVTNALAKLSSDTEPVVRLFALLAQDPVIVINPKRLDAVYALVILNTKESPQMVEVLLREVEDKLHGADGRTDLQ